MAETPAGWYPQQDGRQRYWDGKVWTDHFAPGSHSRQEPVDDRRPGQAADVQESAVRFNPPPTWPDVPAGWRPTRGWAPKAEWAAAPAGWAFWVTAEGAPAAGPPGLFGSTRERRRVGAAALALAAGAGVLGLVIGASLPGSSLSAQSVADLSLVTPTVTQTVTRTVATPGPTVTTPGPTVTTTLTPEPAPTVTETVASEVGEPLPFTDTGGSGADVYYANCTEAREAGVTPLRRGDPGYASHLDGDNDGVACE